MSKLGRNIGMLVLKKNSKKMERETRVHNFKTARTAWIIFDASMENSFPVVHAFRKFLKSEKIECNIIGIVEDKEVPSEMLLRDKYQFITRKDLNWYYKPKGEVSENFWQSAPDILFDFTFKPQLEVQYLVQLSNARFKVGCFTEDDNDYDLMIKPDGPCNLEYFVDQIKHYINMINPV